MGMKLNRAAAALGKKGGKSRSEKKLRAVAENAKQGGRPPVPTPCRKCGEIQPSARAAWAHCLKVKGTASHEFRTKTSHPECPFPSKRRDEQVWCEICHKWTDQKEHSADGN